MKKFIVKGADPTKRRPFEFEVVSEDLNSAKVRAYYYYGKANIKSVKPKKDAV